MELASFMANEASLKQVIKSQKKSLHSIKLNDLTYEIVPLANDESNMESNLDLLFKPVNGTNKGAQEYYTSIDLLKRLYPEQWESQRSNTALSEKTEIFGPNTQKRILRWAQFKREFADKPMSKDIKKEFRWPAEQLTKLVSIYPGALQDLTRQVGPINWAVNSPGYINYNGLWLLINYGRVTNTNMFVKGSNPCVHQITNHLNYLEGRILQGNDDTIGLHFDAAINAANAEWMNIQLSQDPWILRLFHPAFRNGLRPDYRRIYSMLMSKAMTAFYTVNGERLNLPQHIHMEISRVISDYCSNISKVIGFNQGNAGRTGKGYRDVIRPILRDELLYIELWPAPPPNLQKGERGRMSEDKYAIRRAAMQEKQFEQFRAGQRMENEIYNAAMNGMHTQSASSPFVSNSEEFRNDEDDEFELRHFDLSDVSGINWGESGGYQWTEPTPEGEWIRIDLNDIDFNVKSKRGLKGIQVMAENRRRDNLFNALRHTIEVAEGEIEEGKVYSKKDLEAWGWTRANIDNAINAGILERIKKGEYVFKDIDWEAYYEWVAQQEEKKKNTKYRTVSKEEEIGTNMYFGSKAQKQRIKVDNLLQEQGKSKEEREQVWAASVEKEKVKKKQQAEEPKTTVNKSSKVHISVNIAKKDEKMTELEQKEKNGTITEKEKRQLQLKRLAYQREQKRREKEDTQ